MVHTIPIFDAIIGRSDRNRFRTGRNRKDHIRDRRIHHLAPFGTICGNRTGREAEGQIDFLATVTADAIYKVVPKGAAFCLAALRADLGRCAGCILPIVFGTRTGLKLDGHIDILSFCGGEGFRYRAITIFQSDGEIFNTAGQACGFYDIIGKCCGIILIFLGDIDRRGLFQMAVTQGSLRAVHNGNTVNHNVGNIAVQVRCGNGDGIALGLGPFFFLCRYLNRIGSLSK